MRHTVLALTAALCLAAALAAPLESASPAAGAVLAAKAPALPQEAVIPAVKTTAEEALQQKDLIKDAEITILDPASPGLDKKTTVENRQERGLFDVIDLGASAVGTGFLSGIHSFNNVLGSGIGINQRKQRPHTVHQTVVQPETVQQTVVQPQIIRQPVVQPQIVQQPIQSQIVQQPIQSQIVQQPIQSQIVQQPAFQTQIVQQPEFQHQILQQSSFPTQNFQTTTYQTQTVPQNVQFTTTSFQPEIAEQSVVTPQVQPEEPSIIATGDARQQRGLFDVVDLGASAVGTGVLSGVHSFNTVLGSGLNKLHPQTVQPEIAEESEVVDGARYQRGLFDVVDLGASAVGTGVLSGVHSFNTVLGSGLNNLHSQTVQQTAFQSQNLQQSGSQPQSFQQSTIQTQTPESGIQYQVVQQQQPGLEPSTVQQFTTFQPEAVQQHEVQPQIPQDQPEAHHEAAETPVVDKSLAA